jgi:threonine dehydrogenase-like Zn-dependent dehydrogenase
MTELVRSRGVIVNVSVLKEPVPIDMQTVNFRELEIVGTRVYTMDDYRTAIEVAQRGDLEKIVTHTFPLEEVSEAFELFRSGREVCKVIIDPAGGAVDP